MAEEEEGLPLGGDVGRDGGRRAGVSRPRRRGGWRPVAAGGQGEEGQGEEGQGGRGTTDLETYGSSGYPAFVGIT